MSTILWFSIWRKPERWKSSVSGYLMSWLKIKKIVILKCHLLLLYATTTNHFSIRLWYVMKTAFYITTGNSQLSGWTKKKFQSTSQSQIAPKKVIVTVWWSAACLIHCSFLNLGKTIISEKYAQQINEMHWKLPHLQTALVNRMGPVLLSDSAQPDSCHTTSTSEVKWTGLWSSASSAIFNSPLTNWLPLLEAPKQLFVGKTPPNSRMQKMLSQSSSNAKAWISKRINKLISHWQKRVDCNGSLFNNDVLSLLIMI